MQKTLLSIFSAMLIFCGTSAYAQFQKGDVELTLDGTIGMNSSSSKSQGSSSSSDRNFMVLTLAPGFYVVDGLSLEPLIGITAVEDYKPGFLLLANVSYTNYLKAQNLGLFFKIGYGLSNAASVPGMNSYNRLTEDLDISVLNLGGGAKFLLGSKAYIKTELNYRRFSWERDYGSWGKSENTNGFLTLLLGIGVLL